MKIALVTIHNANNYGAIFQAFALQVVLSRYGEVKIVNYDNRHISRSFDLVRVKLSLHGLLGMGKDLLRLFPRYRVINSFNKFINDNMELTQVFSASELKLGNAEEFDCYVAGSDQIWNPSCVSSDGLLNPIYFLDFCPEGAKKISYASSMGAYSFSERERLELKGYLKSFSAVSVRERGAKLLLQEVLEREVDHVLDPTLLLSKDDWLESVGISNQVRGGERYILLYTVPKSPLIRRAVDFFSKKIGLKVVAIDQGLSAGAHVDKHIRDAGPQDFIRLFSEADFVITDSFHGVCFSINFGKPFVAVSPGKHANRIESLLSLVGLMDKLVKSESDFVDFKVDADFEGAQEKLLTARCASLGVLSASLEK
ncbi:polysaccharide pyruvyl transferase family protein [Microbulbifer variabilis]|uniref:polysaccharide pyruvyl transferase family protein n=1 Tax=Microbulbifer variabilis TaxID=266805 RepID=UPI000376F855|nr:polysaccharide pyruvyl transferase family protein [Microbulbifer variabilis]